MTFWYIWAFFAAPVAVLEVGILPLVKGLHRVQLCVQAYICLREYSS